MEIIAVAIGLYALTRLMGDVREKDRHKVEGGGIDG